MTRSVALLMLAIGVNGVLTSVAPRYEPVYLFLAAIAMIAWWDGPIAGILAASLLAITYEVLYSPLGHLSPRGLVVPFAVGSLLALLASLARRIHRARPSLAGKQVGVIDGGITDASSAGGETVAALDAPASPVVPLTGPASVRSEAVALLRAETGSLRSDLAAARAEIDRLTHASRTLDRDARTQLAQERARSTVRDDEHARLSSDLAQAVDTIQRLREEASAAQQELASLHEQQQGDGHALSTSLAELAATRASADALRTAERDAAAQLETAQKRIRDLTEELGAAAKRTAAALDRADAEAAARTRKEQEFAAHEQRLHEQYESESEHLQSAAAKALEEIQQLRAAQDELQKALASERLQRESAVHELEALRSESDPSADQERESQRAAIAAAESRLRNVEVSRQSALDELRLTRASEERLREEMERLRQDSAESVAHLEEARRHAGEREGDLRRQSELLTQAEQRAIEAQAATVAAASELAELRERLEAAEAAAASQQLAEQRELASAERAEAATADATRQQALREQAETALARAVGEADDLRQQMEQMRTALTDEQRSAQHLVQARDAALEEVRSVGQLVRDEVEREWSVKLQKIVTDLASDHESDVGDLVTQREEARADARSAHAKAEELQRAAAHGLEQQTLLQERLRELEQRVEAERLRAEEALAAKAARDQEWNGKLQRIVDNLASDHENDLGEAVMLRESARAEARSLEKRVQLLQTAVQEAQASRGPLETRVLQLQSQLESERQRADAETAARAQLDAEWSEKLQTIVGHLASDHEADLGQALMEKEAAKAEARTLGMRVNALQQKLDSDREGLDKALEKWNGVRQSLQARLARAEEELAALRGPLTTSREEADRSSGTTAAFPPPSPDAQRARAEVLEVAAQAQEAFRKATSSGTVRVPAATRRPLVLVVDQDAGVRGLSRETLIAHGFDVLTASDGLEGLRIAISHRPEIVVADAAMPKMDGRELCQLIKSNRATAGVKVVLLTPGEFLEGSERIPSQLAPDSLLQKPVQFELLQTTLATLLQRV